MNICARLLCTKSTKSSRQDGMNVATQKNMNTITPPPAIEFRNVSISFDNRLALNNISFTLTQGEMIFLTGISESGKSVLLRLAMGLLKPDSGQIFIEGREIENLNESELIDIRGGLMGMVFQEDSLFTGLPVYENAAYRLEEHDWSEEEIDRSVREVLQFVGLEGEEEKYPEELSGGMKRRLEIARALIGWPRIMLFDEPAMGLDPLAALKVLDLIIRARDINHISSIYVTKKIHEIDYLAHYCAESARDGEVNTIEAPPTRLPRTRVIVLEAGRIVLDGSVEDFAKSELPAIKEMLTLDRHDHSHDPEFSDPWDKRRRPAEAIL
ncbi:MAG TPA: ATP-binding cassette domain-containing protein [Pyrinomonadaceae bacterium]|nr:ATP-binding cassette domain-containing protein [Pyrinomonadaceae bacterium]